VSTSTQTRKQRREQARAERKAQAAAEAARARRNRRMWQLGAVVVAALAIVGVAVAISSSGGGTKPPSGSAPAAGGARAAALLNGIPQHGNVLGNPNAPVTLQEFADLQCPVCQAYSQNAMPRLIRDYVRTGRVRMVFRNLPIIGPDSERAAQVAASAAQKNRVWNFADVFYANQGTENTGYVTDAFMTKVARAAGVNASAALAQPPSAAAKAELRADATLTSQYGLDSTPSFLIGKTGRTPAVLSQFDVLDPTSFTGPIDSLLGK
jgi:protein-disulfide isomerase